MHALIAVRANLHGLCRRHRYKTRIFKFVFDLFRQFNFQRFGDMSALLNRFKQRRLFQTQYSD